MNAVYSNSTDWESHPHRCRYCEYADEVSGTPGTYICGKTSRIVHGNQIPECYACVFYSEVKK